MGCAGSREARDDAHHADGMLTAVNSIMPRPLTISELALVQGAAETWSDTFSRYGSALGQDLGNFWGFGATGRVIGGDIGKVAGRSLDPDYGAVKNDFGNFGAPNPRSTTVYKQ